MAHPMDCNCPGYSHNPQCPVHGNRSGTVAANKGITPVSVSSSEWMDALEASAAAIKAAREKGEQTKWGDYCWNFEEAEKQILGTLANIRRRASIDAISHGGKDFENK